MRDYEELVESLRCNEDVADCWKCEYGRYTNRCDTARMMLDAADAIEKLQAELVTMRNQLPKWISVEERLPEFHMNDSGCVCTRNIVFRAEYKTVHLGYVIRTAHNIETVDGFEQILMDKWYDQTGDMIEGVTHWMELPKLPKEDGE